MNSEGIIQHLSTIIDCEQFLITGSGALKHLGFSVIPKDIDIKVVNAKAASITMLKKLAEANPPTTPFKYPEHHQDRVIRFKMDGVDVDVFLEQEKVITSIKTNDGIAVTPLNYIVMAKKKMGRAKDFIQLRRLCNDLVTGTEFTNFLNNCQF